MRGVAPTVLMNKSEITFLRESAPSVGLELTTPEIKRLSVCQLSQPGAPKSHVSRPEGSVGRFSAQSRGTVFLPLKGRGAQDLMGRPGNGLRFRSLSPFHRVLSEPSLEGV